MLISHLWYRDNINIMQYLFPENFESSCEESDIGQTKDNESRTSPKPSSASPKTNEPGTFLESRHFLSVLTSYNRLL